MKNENQAMDQARAQYRSVQAMVAALDCDFDRLEELRESRAPFFAGWNLPGCLPDSEPGQFQTADDAREYLADEIVRYRDEIEDDEKQSELDALELEILKSDAEELTGHAGGFAWWIVRDDGRALSEDDAEELAELEDDAGECEDAEDAEQRIHEDALSVEVRSGWRSVGEGMTADEFRIVLCTGGPHVEIRGELDLHGEPCSARIYFNDWFEVFRSLPDTDEDVLLRYCSQFYFGE